MYIFNYTGLTNFYNIFTIIWQSASFMGLFFFFPPYASFACALFVFSFKYLYAHTQLYWHNTFLQHFHNYWGVNFLKVKINNKIRDWELLASKGAFVLASSHFRKCFSVNVCVWELLKIGSNWKCFLCLM